jgi:membrane-associated phospholipid phosphatase
VLYAALVLLAIGSFFLDAPVNAYARSDDGRAWRKPMGLVSEYGDWPWLMLAGGLLLVAGWRLGASWRRVIVAMILVSTIAGAMTNTLRLTTGRTRPSLGPQAQEWHGPSRLGQYKYNSFPSGHTATAAGFALPLVFCGVPLAILGIGLTLLMIVARIIVQAHHPSDTMCALLLAVIAVDLVWHRLMPVLARRFRLLR